ncbi:MAG: Coenzyme F420 hydrogenase/dehydrogenase, beta subunit C-terminal domain [Candidatus Helarchaeota archaeon]
MQENIVKVKTFEDLEKEVIAPNICSLCGGCVAVCGFNNINAIEIQNNIPKFIEADYKVCLECGLCYQICPRTSSLNKQLYELYGTSEPIGLFKKLTWAQSRDPEILKHCQDGGIVSSLIKYLLDTEQIDGAIVNFAQSNWESFPIIIRSNTELSKASGTRYSVTPLLKIFQKPKIFDTSLNKIEDIELSTLKSLMNLNELHYARLAFVGCPCHIQTIRKMQILKIKPATTIKYLIGLFCMENFSYTNLMKNMIEGKLKINLEDIKKVNIKKDFIITFKDGSITKIPFNDIEEIVRPNCLFCPDFSNIYADISIGGIGAPQNNSTVIIRTDIGEDLFKSTLKSGYITEYKESREKIIELTDKNIKIIQKMSKIKEERSLKYRKQIRFND